MPLSFGIVIIGEGEKTREPMTTPEGKEKSNKKTIKKKRERGRRKPVTTP
jgi:hypothetical protein